MKIAIGPLVGQYGGVTQHIRNIIQHSKYSHRPITPSPFSVYYSNSWFKRVAESLLRKYRIDQADPYGLFLSHAFSSKFDIVHLHGHPYWPEIYRKPKNSRAKYIHTVHQVYLKEDSFSLREWHFRRWLNSLLFKFCRESDTVISVSKWLQKLLYNEYIESIYIPNGVCVKECESANPVRFRLKYNIEGDFFLFAARIDKYKRPELFVELAKKMPTKLFVMIGKDVTLESLRAYVKCDIPKNIVCLGELPYCDVMDAFAACKVFVLPSKNEVFGITLLEAMACKKPVVAADNAGPKEIVIHGIDGFLFEPDDVNDLHEKSCMAYDHPEIGERGYMKVKENFDWSIVIKQIDKEYEKLVE